MGTKVHLKNNLLKMKCNHRNCKEEFPFSLNKMYCSRSCKSKECVYRSRDNKPKLKRGRKTQYKRMMRMSEEEIKRVNLLLTKSEF